MYKDYTELFHGLKNFYNGSIYHNQEGTGYKFSVSSVELLENVPFQQVTEASSDEDVEAHSPSATYPAGYRDNEITIDCSINTLRAKDFIYIFLILIYLLVTKRLLSEKIRNSAIVNSFGLREKDIERSKECIWRLIYYGFSSTWLIYTCFIKHQYGREILSGCEAMSGYSLNVDSDEYLICMIEISFYLHATYALLFEDVWKYDSPMVLFHHIVAVITVFAVYSMRIHKLGLTAIVLRDTCDFVLELAKLFMCFRIQHGRKVKSFEYLVKIFFAIFAGSFFVNQLYYFPLYCFYHGLNFIKFHQFRGGIVTSMLTGCVIFLVLDLMWSTLIIRLLYRVYLTDAPLKDLREIEDEEEPEEGENKGDNSLLVKPELVKGTQEIVEDVVSKLHVE